MRRRAATIVAAAALAVALTAPAAFGEEAAAPGPTLAPAEPLATPEATPPAPQPAPDAASQTEAPAPGPGLRRGDTVAAPPAPKPGTGSGSKQGSGGVTAKPSPGPEQQADAEETGAGATAATLPPTFSVPLMPSGSCGPGAVPAILIPIYQRAAATYGLGPQGPSILAAINGVETAFGSNLNVSSAGAVGWMQFMPPTWAAYGVDANGDGVADPYDPEDAIHAAANYLRASGAPADWYKAIYAYNHADWYVAEVLADAQCFGMLGNSIAASTELSPRIKVLSCTPAKPWRKRIPAAYLSAFETAAARYDLGRSGVWALAAVARLESNFGRGMRGRELRRRGPLGMVGSEWKRYAVDGDGDGRIRRWAPADAAATMARMIWSQGGLRKGLFEHNHAKWYVDAALADAARFAGECETTTAEWALALPTTVMAPIVPENLTILNEVARQDIDGGGLDPRLLGLLGAITQTHQVTISSLRSDHSMYTVSGNVSNHYYGRAMDIAVVDGVSCTDTNPAAPCAELARTLATLPYPARPTELIYCFDVDGPGPAFARSDHCDHVHAGYDG